MSAHLGVEVEPTESASVFGEGEALDKAREFTASLARHGEELGLIGPLELPRLWTRHILNCGVLSPLIRPGNVADVGSGAGLPGIILAIARPDAHFTLIEPMERRVAWLESQTQSLGLVNVTVMRARAEDLGAPRSFTQVTARAVSALRTLIPITAPLVAPGGELLLMKGAGAEREIEAAQKQIRAFHLSDIEIVELGQGVISEPTRVVRATVT